MGAPRLPRERYRGTVASAFTACVAQKKRVLISSEVVQPLIVALEGACAESGCFVPVYCFMPDHLHVMFSGWAEESDTWLAMVVFKAVTGRALKLANAPWGWQPRFHDHVVRGTRDWREHAVYIAKNPVRAGLVQEIGEYPFTGCIGVDWHDMFSGGGS